MDKTERELREMLADRRLSRWPTEAQWNAIWLGANAKGYTGGVSAVVRNVDASLLDRDWAEIMEVEPSEAKMMWTEICVRRSVSPFVEVNTPFTEAQKAEATFQKQYDDLTAKGWVVTSNGPDGMELRAPKVWRLSDKILLGVGVVGLVAYGLGLLIIGFALARHYLFNNPPTAYLERKAAKK